MASVGNADGIEVESITKGADALKGLAGLVRVRNTWTAGWAATPVVWPAKRGSWEKLGVCITANKGFWDPIVGGAAYAARQLIMVGREVQNFSQG